MRNHKIPNGMLAKDIGLLQPHDHPCLIYETRQEMVAAVTVFIRIGLERGERCLTIIPEVTVASFLEDLASAGIDTTAALARGALYIPDIHDIYHSDAPFDAAPVFEFLDRAINEAKADGFTGLRMIEDMSWTLEGCSGTEALIKYEAGLNDFIHSRNLLSLCMYDRGIFPPVVLLDVLGTHQKVIHANTLSRSISFLPPEEFFISDRADGGVNHILQGMLSNAELITALEGRLALLSAVVDNSPDIIYVKDLDGRYLLMNPAGAALFGKPIEEILGRTTDDFLSAEDAAAVSEADKQTYVTDHPLTTELTYTLSGVSRTFLVIKALYRNTRGEVVGLFGISRDITERKQAEQDAANNREQLRLLASQLTIVEEREWRRIASAIHDQLGQQLALANIKLGSLMSMESSVELRENIRQTRELIEDLIRTTRSMTSELSPPCLFDIGLEAALHSFCEVIRKQHGISIGIKYDDKIGQLTDDLRAFLFNGVRELLVNIVKHARANKSEISLERNGDYIVATVEDNGVGFSYNERDISSGKHKGFGLFSLRERLLNYGGCFDVSSTPGQSTRVTLVVPLMEKKDSG